MNKKINYKTLFYSQSISLFIIYLIYYIANFVDFIPMFLSVITLMFAIYIFWEDIVNNGSSSLDKK